MFKGMEEIRNDEKREKEEYARTGITSNSHGQVIITNFVIYKRLQNSRGTIMSDDGMHEKFITFSEDEKALIKKSAKNGNDEKIQKEYAEMLVPKILQLSNFMNRLVVKEMYGDDVKEIMKKTTLRKGVVELLLKNKDKSEVSETERLKARIKELENEKGGKAGTKEKSALKTEKASETPKKEVEPIKKSSNPFEKA